MATLEIYREKNVVEKAFGELKERLNMRSTLISPEQSLNGKLFIEFIPLIYLSYIKKYMQEKNLFNIYLMQSLLGKLDVDECLSNLGRNYILVKFLRNKRRDILILEFYSQPCYELA